MNNSIKELLSTAVDEMLKFKMGYPSASFSSMRGVRVSRDNTEERISFIPPQEGVVLRILSSHQKPGPPHISAGVLNGAPYSSHQHPYFEEVATSELNRDALLKKASYLRERFENARIPFIEPAVANNKDSSVMPQNDKNGCHLTFATDCKIPPSKVSLKDKMDCVRELHAKLKSMDRRLINVNVTYSDIEEVNIFADRARVLEQNIILTSISFTLFASQDNRTEYNWWTRTGTGGFELTHIPDSEIEKTKESLLQLLHAERINPGFYDTITSPTVSGVIAHEAFGHGVETDMFLKDRARGRDYIGRSVASEIVSMADDPSIPGAAGSYFFDHEGKLATPTIIIEDGILKRGITDLFSSISLVIPRSANGRRESFKRKVYTRMSNTFFKRGKTSPEVMIKGVDNGIYLEKCESGMEDPKGWGIQVTAHIGREIKNGKFTGRVYSPVGITGYVPDLLKSISEVGNDFKLEGGGCGKGHKEFVRVSTGGPHLRMKARLG